VFGLGFRIVHRALKGDRPIYRGLAYRFQQTERKQGGDKADDHSPP
jgi:hypothetical protein